MPLAKSSRSGRDHRDHFELRISSDGGSYVLEAYGLFDGGTAGLLESTIRHGEETSCRNIVVDLSGVDFVASAVMEVLADADARSHGDVHRLLMLRAPNDVHRAFEQSGLAARLPFIG